MTSVSLGMPAVPPRGFGNISAVEPFPRAAHRELGNAQLRANLGHATHTIRDKRLKVVSELPDWEALRDAGSAIKTEAMARLPELLARFEEQFTARGGTVHWARDAAEANRIVEELIRAAGPDGQGVDEVVKVKSMATQEIGLNEYLEERGIAAFETDLAELIVQLGHDKPSHILVPAIHKNRTEIRDIFLREMPGVDPSLTDEPRRLAMAARAHLRRKFLSARVAISGANFGIAETGTLGVVESEGNGRMCLTLPETLITVMGIEKVLPRAQHLEVFMQLLPRSSTGERMNPYTSLWTGVTPGDGPQNVHVILLDNGRTRALADRHGRSALHCIRCSACMNVCPVYERTGGHAYGSTYPGPIGAILSPLLTGIEAEENASLPYASSLCGACFDACPVKINIPEILVHLRGEDVEAKHGRGADSGGAGAGRAVAGGADLGRAVAGGADLGHAVAGGAVAGGADAGGSGSGGSGGKANARRRGLPTQMDVALGAASWALSSGDRLGLLEKGLPVARALAGRDRKFTSLPGLGAGWTQSRDVPAPPDESFRSWWKKREKSGGASGAGSARDAPGTGTTARDSSTNGDDQ